MASFVGDSSSDDENTTYTNWARNVMKLEIDPRLAVFEQSCSMPGQVERGIRAKEAIVANSKLISVPFKSLLCIDSDIQNASICSLRNDLREDDFLALILLHERFCGDKSSWYPHIQLIPSTYHSVINYTEADLEALRGSNLYQIALQWQSQVQTDFEQLKTILQSKSINQEDLFGEELSFVNYRWALCTIWSRCITAERSGKVIRCLVPFLDLLNHNSSTKVGHTYDSKQETLHLYTAQPFSPGEEIFLNYGACSNSRLLMLYGFALAGNPHDSVDLWASMEESSIDYSYKLALLQKSKIDYAEAFQLNSQSLPEKLLAFLRVQFVDRKRLLHLLADRSGKLTIYSPLPDREDEKAVIQAAMDTIQEILDKYPTTLAQDLAAIQQIQGSSTSFQHPMHRALHSLYVVSGEKRVLMTNIRRLKKLLESCCS